MANLEKMIEALKKKLKDDGYGDIENPEEIANKAYEFIKTQSELNDNAELLSFFEKHDKLQPVDFSSYRTRPTSIASTTTTTTTASFNEEPLRDNQYFLQADISWVLLTDYAYVLNYPPKLTICTEFDKEILQLLQNEKKNCVFLLCKINKLYL